MSIRHPITGCDVSQLYGFWAIEPVALHQMVAYAQSNPLPMAAKSEDEGAESKPYVIEDGIARLAITGPMTKKRTSFQAVFGGTSTIALRNALRRALEDDEVKGALIEVDSPGGTVAGTNALAEDIAMFAASKPLHVYVQDTMASAAVWAGSQAGFIAADPVAGIGSIGAMIRLVDTSGVYAKEGAKVHVIATGRFKGIGASGAPVQDEHIAELRRELEGIHKLFVGAVSRGLGLPESSVEAIADGRMHLAADAQRLGLIDAVMSFDQALEHLKQSVSARKLGRGRPRSGIIVPAAQENRTMPQLTNEQLAQLRTLPGCANATAENAAEQALAAAVSLQNVAKNAADQVTALTSQVAQLQAQLQQAQASNQPRKLDELTKQMIARTARAEMEKAIAAKALSPAVAQDLYAKVVGTDANGDQAATYNEAAMRVMVGGDPLPVALFAALARNTETLPHTGQKTGAQPVVRQTPGAAGAEDEELQKLYRLALGEKADAA